MNSDVLRVNENIEVKSLVLGKAFSAWRVWSAMRMFSIDVGGRQVFSGKALAVLIAAEEFVGNFDLNPRSHPADGRCEVMVFAVPPSQRREFLRRAKTGSHLPHPDVLTFRGRNLIVKSKRRVAVLGDEANLGKFHRLSVVLCPGDQQIPAHQ